MDGKLARGMARSTFRSVDWARAGRQERLDALLQPLFRRYQQEGGIAAAQVVGLGLRLRNALAAITSLPVTAEVVRHSTRKRVIVEALFPEVVEGGEQQWVICSGAVVDMGRAELCVVQTVGHFAISLHAVKRLYERSSFQEDDLPQLLEVVRSWNAPLLKALSLMKVGPGAELALPFMGGLLMGTLEVNPPLKPGKGPAFALLSNSSMQQGFLRPAFELKGIGVLTLTINTFVHAQDLHPNQHEVLAAMNGFSRLFATEFAALRAGLLRGLPDERMAARFGGVAAQLRDVDLELINATLLRLFASPEWRCHAEAHRRPVRFLQ